MRDEKSEGGTDRMRRPPARFLHGLCLPLLASVALAGGLLGCSAVPLSSTISQFILSPSTTCEELARWLDVPVSGEVSTPGDVGLIYQPFTVTSVNGQPLQGWYVPPQGEGGEDVASQGTVLLMHGTDGTRSCTIPWLLLAAHNGFGIVTFDYQGFDDSGGEADIATLYDDSSAVLDWIRDSSNLAGSEVHLLGTSLGTGPALALALRRPEDVVSLSCDGAFDPYQEVRGVQMLTDLPYLVIAAGVRRVFPWLLETYDRLDEIALPVLFLSAERDRNTPPWASQAIFDDLGSADKTFWTFYGLGHLQALFYAEPEYVSLLVTFWRDPHAEPDPEAYANRADIVVPDLAVGQ